MTALMTLSWSEHAASSDDPATPTSHTVDCDCVFNVIQRTTNQHQITDCWRRQSHRVCKQSVSVCWVFSINRVVNTRTGMQQAANCPMTTQKFLPICLYACLSRLGLLLLYGTNLPVLHHLRLGVEQINHSIQIQVGTLGFPIKSLVPSLAIQIDYPKS